MTTVVPLLLTLFACSGDPSVSDSDGFFETIDLAERIADKGMEAWPADSLPFDWMQTVWAYGLADLSAANGTTEGLDYNRIWMEDALENFDSDDGFTSSDSLSPAGIASTVMGRDDDADFGTIINAAETYLETVPRLENGAIVHWGPDNPWGFPDDQVWIDSLFMVGMFMLREAERTGDETWLDDFAEQYLAFSALCRDPTSQLYFHAYDDAAQATIPTDSVFWARGNSWIVVAGAAYLAQTEDHTNRTEIAALVQAHALALADLQADDGLWWTVLDPASVPTNGDLPANYTETSASALIATGMHVAMEAGDLDSETFGPVIAAAVEGVIDRIENPDGDPVVTGTSFGTNPGEVEDYLEVPQMDDLILGVGAAVILLSEVDGMESD